MSINFEEIYNVMFNYFHDNIYITIALAVVLLYLLYRKPKLFFSLILVASVLTAVLYVISHLSSAGKESKSDMTNVKNLTF
jgi:hypothetical protein